MVRKRGFDNIYERQSKKVRPNMQSQIITSKPNEVKSCLNDTLLNLYKKENNKLKNNSSADSETEADNNSVNKRVINSDLIETPSASVKRVKRTITKAILPTFSSLNIDHLGGMTHMLEEVFDLFMHYQAPNVYQLLNIQPVRGFLVTGPHGCGKTHLVRCIAGALSVPLIEIASSELVCGISGESEKKLRDTFDAAFNAGRCILFLDEIDAIFPKRDSANNSMEKRMVSQFVKLLDEFQEKDPSYNVMVIGATKVPDSIDSALRGGGRFSQEIAIGDPNESSKIEMLEIMCKAIKLAPDFEYAWIAHHTAGYVAGDLNNLVTKAVSIGTKRIHQAIRNTAVASSEKDKHKILSSFLSISISDEEVSNIYFTIDDFKEALKLIVPFCKREGFATVPNVTWDDVGALGIVKSAVSKAIRWPIKYSGFYEKNNLDSVKGILLYGPKGCGKTLLAKALANECNINFLSVNGPELLNMYLGESERSVREVFERAQRSAPCVIFFDEFDALCPSRSTSSSNVAAERVVNQLLTLMDGVQERKKVFVIAATNRIEKIDSAMMRPGRLEKLIYVGLPSPEGRIDILKSLTKNKTSPRIEEDLELKTIALDERCKDFSGADLASVVREASAYAVEELLESEVSNANLVIRWNHFDRALNDVKQSNKAADKAYFKKYVPLETS